VQKIIEFLFKIILAVLSSKYFIILLLLTLFVAALRSVYVSLKTSALSRLEYSRKFSADGIFEGGELDLIEEIKNDTFFPLFFVRLDFYVPQGISIDGIGSDEGYIKLTSVFNILPRTAVRKVHRVKALRRDHYLLETAVIKYHKYIFNFSVPVELYVYPGRYDGAAVTSPDVLRAGDRISARRYIEDPFFVNSIRDYRFGDPMRSINFKATARSVSGGIYRLLSSSYDSSRDYGLMIFLDLTPYPEVCFAPGDSERLLEEGLAAACYIFRETVLCGGKVGFATNVAVGTKKFTHCECGRGSLHVKRMLETFSEITAYRRRDFSFNALVHLLIPTLPRDVDVYVITPYADPQLCRTVNEIGCLRGVSLIRYGIGGGSK